MEFQIAHNHLKAACMFKVAVFHEAILNIDFWTGRRDMEPTIFQSPGYDLKFYLPRSKTIGFDIPKIAQSIAAIGVELEYILQYCD